MIKDYPFASNGKSCMISISAEERPSLKLTIEASAPMDILDIYQDEYGVFFASILTAPWRRSRLKELMQERSCMTSKT